jgi:ribosomal protein S27AE
MGEKGNNAETAGLSFHCPVCGTFSELVIGPTQAFCTNVKDCNVVCFNPSLPDRGLSQINVIKFETSEPPHFECLRCGKRSYNLNDIEQSYCGNCHVFIDDDPSTP